MNQDRLRGPFEDPFFWLFLSFGDGTFAAIPAFYVLVYVFAAPAQAIVFDRIKLLVAFEAFALYGV